VASFGTDSAPHRRNFDSVPNVLNVEVDLEDSRLALPYLELTVDGVPRRALLDSGAARTSLTAPVDCNGWSVVSDGTGAFGMAADRTERHWNARLGICGVDLGVVEVVDQPAGVGPELIGQDPRTSGLVERTPV
jgi:hypothetical protein